MPAALRAASTPWLIGIKTVVLNVGHRSACAHGHRQGPHGNIVRHVEDEYHVGIAKRVVMDSTLPPMLSTL